MPFDGSGNFTRSDGTLNGPNVWDQNKNAGLKIVTSRHDLHDDDLAQGLEATLTRNGETSPTANLPMAGYRHQNVGLAFARTDYARASQVQDGALIYGGTSTNSGNNYSINLSPAITAYTNGMLLAWKANAANSGAATLNVNGVGQLPLRKGDGTVALVQGDIVADQVYFVACESNIFRLLNRAALEVLTAAGITFTGSTFNVTANTSGGADTAALQLAAGGAVANGRGARLQLFGANHASSAGQAILVGDGGRAFIGTTGAHPVVLHTNGTDRFQVTSAGVFAPISNVTSDLGTTSLHFANIYAANFRRNDGSNLQIMNDANAGISLHTNGASRWVLGGSGDLVADSSNGGDILIRNLTGNVVASAGITATGNNQGTAAGINSTVQTVTSTGAGQGVGLLSSRSGRTYYLLNTSANAVNVYPPVGGAINALGANNPISLPSGRAGLFVCYGANTNTGATGYFAIIGA